MPDTPREAGFVDFCPLCHGIIKAGRCVMCGRDWDLAPADYNIDDYLEFNRDWDE